MAQAEKAKPRKAKDLLSAVYVNRFGKHLSGAVIRFGAKEEKKQRQAAVYSPEGSACPLTANPALDVGVKSHREQKRTTFTPPTHVKSSELPLEQIDAGAVRQNNENADIFKFPLIGKSDAAKGKDRKQKSAFGRKREAFRVIYKMLHENEKFRTRLQANSQKSTLVPDEQTMSESEKDSPKTLAQAEFYFLFSFCGP
ncbi:uncharacterized protein LOC119964176 isoform X2 [Scyliorhinus canicula]|uniref:uncharacterized protein LOC119964176 isoform X2 n=1 Tax=Scyliorhinus canicula TaxID=7830 RepID=UPI0018F5569D|nr:uncharacterized protein LOC119964176 isoform X2 [Scyliorhinus canicula]